MSAARKVGLDRNGKPIMSNLRLPDAHYQPGDTAEVTFEGAVGTIRPKGMPTDEEPCAHAHASFNPHRMYWVCVDCGADCEEP